MIVEAQSPIKMQIFQRALRGGNSLAVFAGEAKIESALLLSVKLSVSPLSTALERRKI